MDLFKWVQAQPFQLAGSGASLGAITIILQSFKDIDGVNLTMADFGTTGFCTMEPGSGTQEEAITFTGVTQNLNGTATLTGIKTQLFKAPYTQTVGLAKSHAGGTSLILTNSAGFYENFVGKGDDETIVGLWNFPSGANNPTIGLVYLAPTLDTQIATKKYVDDVAVAGAPDANTTTKGIVQLPTQAQVDARTALGSTGASLTPTPANLRTVLTHDYVASVTGNDSYAIAPTPAVTAYATGDIYTFSADVGNTGPATLNVAALGARTIKKANDQDLVTGDIEAGQMITVIYDGTNMQMQSPVANTYATQQDVQNGNLIYAADGGGTDAYAIALTPAIVAYTTGMVVNFRANTANTGAATLNVNGLGAISIKKNFNQTLGDGDIKAGQIVTVTYDGTNFQMQSPVGGAPRYFNGFSSRTGASGSQVITGVGFEPKAIIFHAFGQVGGNRSVGSGSWTSASGVNSFNGISVAGATQTSGPGSTTISVAGGDTTSGNYQEGAVSAVSNDGFTISWTEIGAASTCIFTYTCFG